MSVGEWVFRDNNYFEKTEEHFPTRVAVSTQFPLIRTGKWAAGDWDIAICFSTLPCSCPLPSREAYPLSPEGNSRDRDCIVLSTFSRLSHGDTGAVRHRLKINSIQRYLDYLTPKYSTSRCAVAKCLATLTSGWLFTLIKINESEKTWSTLAIFGSTVHNFWELLRLRDLPKFVIVLATCISIHVVLARR